MHTALTPLKPNNHAGEQFSNRRVQYHRAYKVSPALKPCNNLQLHVVAFLERVELLLESASVMQPADPEAL